LWIGEVVILIEANRFFLDTLYMLLVCIAYSNSLFIVLFQNQSLTKGRSVKLEIWNTREYVKANFVIRSGFAAADVGFAGRGATGLTNVVGTKKVVQNRAFYRVKAGSQARAQYTTSKCGMLCTGWNCDKTLTKLIDGIKILMTMTISTKLDYLVTHYGLAIGLVFDVFGLNLLLWPMIQTFMISVRKKSTNCNGGYFFVFLSCN